MRIETYRDGGTLNISDDVFEIFLDHRLRSPTGAVHFNYPGDCDPIQTTSELTDAQCLLERAVTHYRHPTDLLKIAIGLQWLTDRLNESE